MWYYLEPLQNKLFLTKFVYVGDMIYLWAGKYAQFV